MSKKANTPPARAAKELLSRRPPEVVVVTLHVVEPGEDGPRLTGERWRRLGPLGSVGPPVKVSSD